MSYGIDDAFATTLLVGDGQADEVVPALSIRMFPPATVAKRMFRQLAKSYRFEPVTRPVLTWRPKASESLARIVLARNGRTVVTAGDQVLFDDSVGALAPDAIDQAWMEFVGERGKALVLLGGPARIQTLKDLEAAAGDGLLVAGWADVTLPQQTGGAQ